MQFESVRIQDFPPFRDFRLDFPAGVTVIAGANGVGKSRLLAFIAGHRYSIEPTYGERESLVSFKDGQVSDGLIYFESSRVFNAGRVNAIVHYDNRYSLDNPHEITRGDFSKIGRMFKYWFVQMENHEARGRIRTSESRENYELCKEIFSIMDSRYSYLEVTDNFEVMISGPSGPITFDQLSSGFQSAFLLLFGVVFCIDSYSQGTKAARDFMGCILIDEIEIHLHPSWQSEIIRILQAIVPNAQVIATTHSPHVIQGLRENEVIALKIGQSGYSEVKSIRPKPGPYGFQGWTIEEILRDVMGIEDTISTSRQQIEDAFDEAMTLEDVKAAKEPYLKLMSMLHPANPLKSIYQLQFKALGGVAE